jgi:hypothetical protein
MTDPRKPNEYDVIGKRRFHELRPGDMFRARIADIRPGYVTLKLDDGATHTARSLVSPDARIGEESVFLVRENDFEGRIVLEFVKLTPQVKQENMLREALDNAGLSSSLENITFGQKMLNAGIPVEATTLQNTTLHRLMVDPLALFSAPKSELAEILQALLRSSNRRLYYQISDTTEIHVFKDATETIVVITISTTHLGRIEATLKKANNQPIRVSILCDREETLDLLTPFATLQKGINIKSEKNALLSEPFTLLSPPPIPGTPPVRFNLDIRV